MKPASDTEPDHCCLRRWLTDPRWILAWLHSNTMNSISLWLFAIISHCLCISLSLSLTLSFSLFFWHIYSPINAHTRTHKCDRKDLPSYETVTYCLCVILRYLTILPHHKDNMKLKFRFNVEFNLSKHEWCQKKLNFIEVHTFHPDN